MEQVSMTQTPQVKMIPTLLQRDHQRAIEAKERWEKARASTPAPAATPDDLLPVRSAQPVQTVIAPAVAPKKLRVAAYCRVSTGTAEQEISMENQRFHYEQVIQNNPDWEFVDVYWEAGVSGTKRESRPALQRLLADCEAGKINLVLTKSISRFARNTSDCLEMIRTLKELGVTVRFEKENIDTGSMESELLLTLFSTFAEEESHSISRNTAWTKRKQFQEGTFKYSIAPFGYRLVGGTFEIDPVQAPIVREIYDRVLAGIGTPTIAKELNARGIATGTKKNDGSPGVWHAYMIGGMIPNVVYLGDVLMQKTFRDEHFHLFKNYGERPQYYCDGHHPAIIDRETFELANAALRQRGKEKGNVPMADRRRRDNPHSNRYAFTGKLKCGCCGGSMRRITQKVHDGKQYHWGCTIHIEEKEKCWMRREYEETIQNAFITMLNKLVFAEDVIFEIYLTALKNEHSIKQRKKIQELKTRLNQISSEKNRLSILIAKGCEPVSFRAKKLELEAEYSQLLNELEQLQRDPAQMKVTQELREQLDAWKKRKTDGFPEKIFARIVDFAIVRTSVEIEFHLKCGMVLTEVYSG